VEIRRKLPSQEEIDNLLKESHLLEADVEYTCIRVVTTDANIHHWHYPGGNGGWEKSSL
jgi:hypothetical protein